MAVSAKFIQELGVTETLSLGLDLVTNPSVFHGIGTDGRVSGTLTASSVVPGTKVYSDTITLSAGAYTIDLTTLGGPLSTSVTLSGLKPQLWMIQAASTNTDVLEFDVGGTNGYNWGGDATSHIALTAGASVLFYWPDNLADVGASAKTIDVSSADVDAIFKIVIVAG